MKKSIQTLDLESMSLQIHGARMQARAISRLAVQSDDLDAAELIDMISSMADTLDDRLSGIHAAAEGLSTDVWAASCSLGAGFSRGGSV